MDSLIIICTAIGCTCAGFVAGVVCCAFGRYGKRVRASNPRFWGDDFG